MKKMRTTRLGFGGSNTAVSQCLLILIVAVLFNFGCSNVLGDCLGERSVLVVRSGSGY